MLKVAILGCPNVGKSTLFNKMVRRQQAIAHDKPGVTRDYNEGICNLAAGRFIVIDSPGWGHDDSFAASIQEKIQQVIQLADLILLMIDAEINSSDREFSLWLRKNTNIAVILVVNKCEKQAHGHGYELGWDNVINIAAQHNIGLNKLYDEITHYITESLPANADDLKISIVGRPNVGKSTFINQLLKENRVITSPISGTTRDAIAIHWQYKGKNLTLIDTAGMRKKAKVKEEIESRSIGSSIYSIRQADVVILMIDAERGLEQQDISIVEVVMKEGKSLLIAVNKADLAEQRILSHIKDYCSRKLQYEIPIVTISALKNKACNKIIDGCIKSHEVSTQTISTALLNKWLSGVMKQHAPPLSSRKTEIRLKFIAQIATVPMTFRIIANRPEDIGKSYIRYLTNELREAFSLWGVPISIVLKKNHNPYVK